MHAESVKLLNKAIADELAAIHQYMYFHFHCDDKGYDLLASLFKRAAIDEMIHVERCAERVLFLEGDVDMKAAENIQQIKDVRGMLERAAAMEAGSAKDYNLWANICGNNADSVTKKLFEALVAEEEGHYDRYKTELDNLDKFGDSYLALQSIERSKTLAAASAPAAD